MIIATKKVKNTLLFIGSLPGLNIFLPVSVDIDQLLCLPEPLTPANGFSCNKQMCIRDRGYIEKRRGVGTFVAEREKLNSWDLGSLKSFEEAFKESNHKIRTEALSIKAIKLDSKLQQIFGDKEKEVYELERVRFIDERPAMSIITFVPASIFSNMDRYDFSSVSLYKTCLLYTSNMLKTR